MHPFLGSRWTSSTLWVIRWTFIELSNCTDLVYGCSFYLLYQTLVLELWFCDIRCPWAIVSTEHLYYKMRCLISIELKVHSLFSSLLWRFLVFYYYALYSSSYHDVHHFFSFLNLIKTAVRRRKLVFYKASNVIKCSVLCIYFTSRLLLCL